MCNPYRNSKKELKKLNVSYSDYQLSELIDDIEIAIIDESEFIFVTDGYEEKELMIETFKKYF